MTMSAVKQMGATVLIGLTLAACGGATASDATTAPVAVTTAAPATTQAPSTTRPPATTTTVAGMSREATLALARCVDQFGFLYAEQVSLDVSYLTDAQDLCEEAKLQLEIEPAADEDVVFAFYQLAVDLGFAKLDVSMGQFDVASQAKLQAAVDAFVVSVEG